MQKKTKIGLAAFGGLVATFAAGGTALASVEGPARMGRGDANGDGVISKAEWMQMAEMRFAKLDANKDGKLDQSERPRHHGHRGGRGGHHRFGGEGAPAPMGNQSAPGN